MIFHFRAIATRDGDDFDILHSEVFVQGFDFPQKRNFRPGSEWAHESFFDSYSNRLSNWIGTNSEFQTLGDIQPGDTVEVVGTCDIQMHRDYWGEYDETMECVECDWQKIPMDVVKEHFGPHEDQEVTLLKRL